MKHRVVRRRRARDDIVQCAQLIAENRPRSALEFLDAIESSLRTLAEYPRMGRVWNLRMGPTVRSWPVTGFNNFLIFYCPIDEGIRLLRVLHRARDIDASLLGIGTAESESD